MLRINVKGRVMAQDGAVEAMTFERPSISALKRIAADINYNKVLKWTDPDEALEQFYALVEKPPLHSVVIQFSPEVAAKLMDLTNTKNRPKQWHHAGMMSKMIEVGDFGVTGDTLKWSNDGTMLDGQHRLHGCINSKKPFTTHAVFGIDGELFDLLDQGKKRSPGDVLALCGVSGYNIVAGAVRRAVMIQDGSKGNNPDYHLTPRKIKELAVGPMKGIQEWIAEARNIQTAFKHPASMIAATLYLIAKHSRMVAKDFAHEWMHGARIGRNKNFDVLSQRFISVQRQGGGHINHIVRSAMIIQTFNYWNAGIVATPIGLKFDKKWAFPKLEFNKAAFLKRKDQQEQDDTSLATLQKRMLVALGRATGKDGNVELPVPELAKRSSVPANQVAYVLSTMADIDLVHCSRKRSPHGPAIWRLRDEGIAKLRASVTGNGAAA